MQFTYRASAIDYLLYRSELDLYILNFIIFFLFFIFYFLATIVAILIIRAVCYIIWSHILLAGNTLSTAIG